MNSITRQLLTGVAVGAAIVSAVLFAFAAPTLVEASGLDVHLLGPRGQKILAKLSVAVPKSTTGSGMWPLFAARIAAVTGRSYRIAWRWFVGEALGKFEVTFATAVNPAGVVSVIVAPTAKYAAATLY